MKYLALIFFVPICLSPLVAQSANFLTGQAARMTIGQPTFTAQSVGAPSAYQVGAVSSVAYASNTLFLVDSNHIQAQPVNNRILIYNNISKFLYPPTSEIPQGDPCPVCIGAANFGADVVVGQPDFVSTGVNQPAGVPSQTGLRTPTGVATNGQILAVADTDNNRVLIWKTIPTTNGAPADIVLGQPDFNTFNPPTSVTASGFRGPQGVWIQGTRLFVADTQNHRVMVWNNIPSTNNQAADYVLGEPNLTTAPPPTVSLLPPQANNLFSPVSVTSDGQRLFVTDLGHNRVLIWNAIPTQTQQPADVVLGQPDMTSDADNNVLGSCVSNGTDSDMNPTYPAGCTPVCPPTGMDSAGNPTYPQRCGATLSFPRYALSDGQRLFVADGGNDRVLVYNSIPTQNGQLADIILGQADALSDNVSNSAGTFRPDANIQVSSPDTIRTPMGLAWDGTNLFVTDPFDMRLLVFTIGQPNVPINGITNAASLVVYAIGTVTFSGTITANDTITVTINGTNYKYTVVAADNLTTIVTNMIALINGTSGGTPDPNVVATPNLGFNQIILTSRLPGADGNNVTYSATVAAATSSGTATETATTAGVNLNGGQNAAEVAPATLVTINGTNLSDTSVPGTPDSNGFYPTSLGGVQVYFDGIKAPLVMVSPTQITAQIPYEVSDRSGVSAYVRTVHSDNSITNTTAVAVPIVGENPGIFAAPGSDPRPAMAFHASSNAIALVSVDGAIVANDTATVTIQDRSYAYILQSTDTLTTVRDALVALINANPDEKVTASPSSLFNRLILTAKVAGPDGNGIAISVASGGTSSVILTALNPQTCCASVAGAPITPDSPAVPGEVITIYATGLGLTTLGDGTTPVGKTGQVYSGPAFNIPQTAVDNAQLANTTANVLSAGLKPGMLGVYEVQLQISSTLPTNPNTPLFIAQSVFTSNIVTIPIVAP
ncbi:MAG TPA: IPT/TIG domain-containing protein [Bryobacteraceae bacterium]|nr:IPT/TIG domain-containing protein [Bryobacteraceae bacterium]